MEADRVVSRQRGAQLAAEMKCHFFEASAKNKINVEGRVRKLNYSLFNSNAGVWSLWTPQAVKIIQGEIFEKKILALKKMFSKAEILHILLRITLNKMLSNKKTIHILV